MMNPTWINAIASLGGTSPGWLTVSVGSNAPFPNDFFLNFAAYNVDGNLVCDLRGGVAACETWVDSLLCGDASVGMSLGSDIELCGKSFGTGPDEIAALAIYQDDENGAPVVHDFVSFLADPYYVIANSGQGPASDMTSYSTGLDVSELAETFIVGQVTAGCQSAWSHLNERSYAYGECNKDISTGQVWQVEDCSCAFLDDSQCHRRRHLEEQEEVSPRSISGQRRLRGI